MKCRSIEDGFVFELRLMCAWVLLTCLAGTSGLHAEEDSGRNQKANDNDSVSMVVTLLNRKTGDPIVGADINIRGRAANRIRENLKSDEFGQFLVRWKPGKQIHSLSITIRKEKFVPYYLRWDDDQHPVRLPIEKSVRLEPGNALTGRVVDEQGKPIRNASVEINLPATEYEGSNFVFSLAELQTDDQGRWSLNTAPADIALKSCGVSHPDYLGSWTRLTLEQEVVTVLKKGASISGRVVDRNRAPIAAAAILWGDSSYDSDAKKGVSDEEGEFELKNGPAEKTFVTVAADGFAPQRISLLASNQTEPLEFTMTKGGTIRGRVVDRQGNPVGGAFVAVERWRGAQTLQFRTNTDPEGRFDWNSAPQDEVELSYGKAGFMYGRNHKVTAGNEEITLTLLPHLVISGKIIDAESEELIPLCKITVGAQYSEKSDFYWRTDSSFDQENGFFQSKFDEPARQYRLRFEAVGYHVFESRVFRSNEANVSFDVALEKIAPSNMIHGTVVAADGKPAQDVQLFLCNRRRRLDIVDGVIRRDSEVPKLKLDAEGGFQFNRPKHEALLLAINDQGIAHLPTNLATSPVRLVIEPWGRIEGRLFSKGKTKPSKITFQPLLTERHQIARFVYSNNRMPLNDNGRFSADRVIPGPGYLSKIVAIGEEGHYGWQQRVDILPGKTVLVRYGGNGKTLRGRIVFDPPVMDFSEFRFRGIRLTRRNLTLDSPRFNQTYSAQIESGGEFQMDDVPPGEYEASISVYPRTQSKNHRPAIGNGRTVLTVEAGLHELHHLEPIVVQLNDTLEPGEMAPGFAVEAITDDIIRFQDYQGKLLVIDFRSMWEEADAETLASLREIYQRFGDHPRFAMLTMAMARDMTRIESFRTENNIQWSCANAGMLYDKTCRDFMLQDYPILFAIGPDGKVMAKTQNASQLVDVIEKSLDDNALFESAASVVLPRRYQAFQIAKQEPPAKFAQNSGVLVLSEDHSSTSNKKTGSLRLYSSDAIETAAIEGLRVSRALSVPLAVDVVRSRIYHCSQSDRTLTAYDAKLNSRWSIRGISTNTISVDPRTGEIWCSVGGSIQEGETVVFDFHGNELRTFPFRPLEIAHDPASDTFWLAGKSIVRLTRAGSVLRNQPIVGWTAASVTIDRHSGNTWIGERDHPDVESKNCLWFFGKDFETPSSIDLEADPRQIAFHPQTKSIWMASYRALHRIDIENPDEIKTWDYEARGVTVNQTSGDIWISLKNAVLKIDENGDEIARLPLEGTVETIGILGF